AQLDEVRGLGLIPDGERLLPHRLEERQTGVDGVRGAGGYDEQLGRRCHLGPPEDRCGDKTLAGVRARRGEPVRKCHACRAPRDGNPELLGCIIRARVARGWRGTRGSGAVESSARVSTRRQTSPFELTVRLGPVPRTLRALERGRWRRARGRAVGTFGARLASNLRSRPRRRVWQWNGTSRSSIS